MKRFTQILLTILAVIAPHTTWAQAPSVEVPIEDIHAIAIDFDQGLNRVYCYFGTRVDTPQLSVRVDSVTLVGSPAGCAGIGIGFFLRINDQVLLAEAIRGVIQSNPRFAVVSAFYRTEDIEDRGQRIRGARALSVVRGASTVVARQGGS
jgi:hypothetical protein